MSSKAVIKRINKVKWWVEEGPSTVFLFDYIMKDFVHAEHILGFPTLKEMICIIKDGIGTEITPWEGKKKEFLYILNQEIENPGFFKKTFEPWFELIEKKLPILNNIAINEIGKYNDKQLLGFTKEAINAILKSTTYGALLECIDPFSEDYQEEFRNKYELSEEDCRDFFVILSSPKERSFLTQNKLDFYSLCLGKLSIDEYLKKWYWINTNFKQLVDIEISELNNMTRKELKEKGELKIKKEIKETFSQEKKLIEQKNEFLKKLKLEKRDKIIFELFETFAHYIDQRKESMIRQSYTKDKIIREISRRKSKYSLDFLRNMRDNEIIALLEGRDVDSKEIEKRHLCYVAYYTPDSDSTYSGKEALNIHNAWSKSLNLKEIKGRVASSPVNEISGEICVVMDAHKDGFKTGTILVTSMTRPEFMPLMRKAKAVITDEGGVTCHAAIISRELKIPCIIGTKNATKILKNKDFVKMDLKNGSVKIIK